MAKRSIREFGRFDVDFLESEAYLLMPAELRNDAYLYLLALSGRSRKRRTDGVLPLVVAEDLAARLGRSARELLAALALKRVALVKTHGQTVRILKYSKWQQTAAEIEEVRADGRSRTAKSRISNTHVTPMSHASNGDVTRMSHASNKTEIEREGEVEKERDLSLPLPSLVENHPTGNGAKALTRTVQFSQRGYKGGEMTSLSEHLPKLVKVGQ